MCARREPVLLITKSIDVTSRDTSIWRAKGHPVTSRSLYVLYVVCDGPSCVQHSSMIGSGPGCASWDHNPYPCCFTRYGVGPIDAGRQARLSAQVWSDCPTVSDTRWCTIVQYTLRGTGCGTVCWCITLPQLDCRAVRIRLCLVLSQLTECITGAFQHVLPWL